MLVSSRLSRAEGDEIHVACLHCSSRRVLNGRRDPAQGMKAGIWEWYPGCLPGGRQWWLCQLSPGDVSQLPYRGRLESGSGVVFFLSLSFLGCLGEAVMPYVPRKNVQGGAQRLQVGRPVSSEDASFTGSRGSPQTPI